MNANKLHKTITNKNIKTMGTNSDTKFDRFHRFNQALDAKLNEMKDGKYYYPCFKIILHSNVSLWIRSSRKWNQREKINEWFIENYVDYECYENDITDIYLQKSRGWIKDAFLKMPSIDSDSIVTQY